MILPVAAVALPYFLFHFPFLYYYYAEWNLDANAHLSWGASVAHLAFAFQHLGWTMAVAAGLCFAASLWDNRKSFRVSHLDWKLFYLGSAPVLFLVLRGAGLNPFVSLPAVFGWLLFLLAPVSGNVLTSAWSRKRWRSTLGCVCVERRSCSSPGRPILKHE